MLVATARLLSVVIHHMSRISSLVVITVVYGEHNTKLWWAYGIWNKSDLYVFMCYYVLGRGEVHLCVMCYVLKRGEVHLCIMCYVT
jgi:hypothetical protein